MNFPRLSAISRWVVLAVGLFLFGVSGLAQLKQDSDAPAPDVCSNGILEMSLRAKRNPPDGPPRRNGPAPVPIWAGLIEVRYRNVSSLMVRLFDAYGQYDVAVIDASGKPAPLTEAGKQELPPRKPSMYLGVFTVNLAPGEQHVHDIRIQHYFEIDPGEAYTIRLSRIDGLPTKDQIGNPISHPELTCSLTIPAGPLVEMQ